MAPFDDKSPFVTSGIRIGTAAVTTRGLVESDMRDIVALIDEAITHFTDTKELETIATKVHAMMAGRPLFKS